jgi:hypothetical protein
VAVSALVGGHPPRVSQHTASPWPALHLYPQGLSDGRFTNEVAFTAGDEVMRCRDYWRDYWRDRDGVLLYDGYDVLPLAEATPAP